jgi:hypothetical protein
MAILAPNDPLGVFVSVMPANGFIDDRDMDFTNHPIRVAFETSGGNEIAERRIDLARSLALLSAATLSFKHGLNCMVVEEVDELIEKFPGRR